MVSQEELEKAGEQQMYNETISGQKLQNTNQQNNDQLVNPEKVKLRLKKSLKGIKYTTEYNADQGRYYRKEIENKENALVNDLGFSKIWSIVEGLINENMTGAVFNNKDIYGACKPVMNALIKQIAKKRDKWGIEDLEDAEEVVSIVLANILATASKARGGRAMQHLETSTEKRILQKTGEDKKDKSFLSNLFN